MSFSPTIKHESSAVPGTTFVVHRIGFGRGTEIDFQALTHRQRLRELEADYPPPSDKEREITEALEIAKRKALAVDKEQFEAVVEADVKPLATELAAAIPADVRKRRAVLNEEYQVVDARIRAVWIRSGLISISGGEVDGMTADELLDFGPPQLAQEIYEALTSDGRLKGSDPKNLPSLITSGPVVGGESLSSIAPDAKVLPADGTLTGTALSTSLAA